MAGKRVPKPTPDIVITNKATKRKTKGDPFDVVLADPVVGPMLERSALKEHFWGKLSAITPAEALLEEVQRTHALLLWIEYELEQAGGLIGLGVAKPDRWVFEAALDDEHQSAVWAEAQVKAYSDSQIVKALSVYYQVTREHLVDATTRAEKSRLAERMVALKEAQAHMLFLLVRGVFDDPRLGLTATQHALLPGLIRTHLTTVVNANAAADARRLNP